MKRAAKRARRHVARKLGVKYDRSMEGAADVDWKRIAYGRQATAARRAKKNPTKAERAVAAQKRAVERRVASALAKFLKQANPAMKTAGAKIQKLKGGVLKITPIKRNAVGSGRKDYRSLASAQKAMDRLRAKGIYDAGIVYDAASRMYRLLWKGGK